MLYAKDFRHIAWNALRGRWALALGTGLVAVILGAETQANMPSFNWGSGSSSQEMYSSEAGLIALLILLAITAVMLPYLLITIFFGGVIQLGYCRFNKNIIRNGNPQFNDLFSNFDIFWKAFGLRFMVGLFTFLWTLLLIIPGIIATYRYSMAFYIMDENPSIGILEAIDRSKQLMKGNKWRLFCLEFSFIGWFLLSMCTCYIGLLWLRPYINAAKAVFFLEISRPNYYPLPEQQVMYGQMN